MQIFNALTMAVLLLIIAPQAVAMKCSDVFTENTEKYISKAIDALPVGTKKVFTEEKYSSEFEAAQKRLVEALDKAEWERVAEDGEYIQTPMNLNGETIAGVTRISGADGTAIIIFAGKVEEVINISGANDRPYYHARINGPDGKQIINISSPVNTQSVHMLAQP